MTPVRLGTSDPSKMTCIVCEHKRKWEKGHLREWKIGGSYGKDGKERSIVNNSDQKWAEELSVPERYKIKKVFDFVDKIISVTRAPLPSHERFGTQRDNYCVLWVVYEFNGKTQKSRCSAQSNTKGYYD